MSTLEKSNHNLQISKLGGVSPDKANRILDRLNSFDSADEIVRITTICSRHGSLGTRAAQRIFATKLALGEYQDLQQLAAVPGIGIKKLALIIRALID